MEDALFFFWLKMHDAVADLGFILGPVLNLGFEARIIVSCIGIIKHTPTSYHTPTVRIFLNVY